MGEDQVERVVGKRQVLAVGFAQIGRQPLLREVLPRQRDRRRPTDRRRTTIAPPRAKRARSVPAPQPTSSTVLAAIAVEVDQPQQVVQLLEVVLIEIGEEARRSRPGAS